jgi:flagellar biosynthesis chaperone FliJ
MKRRYPLSALKTMRERIKEGREQQLAAAVSAEQSAQDAVSRALEQRTERDRKLQQGKKAASEAMSRIATAMTHQQYCRRLAGELEQADRDVAQAQKALIAAQNRKQQARFALADALQQLKAVENDFERWSEKQAKEAERAAELELDDIVAGGRTSSLSS